MKRTLRSLNLYGMSGIHFYVLITSGLVRVLSLDRNEVQSATMRSYLSGGKYSARYSLDPSVFNIMHKSCVMFLIKKMLCILSMGTTTDHLVVVICPVQTNKTSNSIPSVIKGYLDRNINISLKLNQMLLHGGRQDSEEGKRNAEKQGRYFTQESESVPRFQHFEIFIPLVLRPPSPPKPSYLI